MFGPGSLNHFFPKTPPNLARAPDASVCKSRVFESSQLEERKKLAPFQLSINVFHIAKTLKKPELSLMWWCCFLTFLVRAIMRCKNGRPGGTTLHAKFKVSIRDCNCFKVSFLLKVFKN